jgi:hypothetical protein
MIITHDGNINEFIESAHEYPGLCGTLPSKSEIGKTGYARPYTDIVDMIPPSKYGEYYDAMVGKFARQRWESFQPIHQYQGNHPLCWAYSLAQHLEAVRAKIHLPYQQLAPESILGCNGYRDIGGFLDVALLWASKHGMAPRSMVPQYEINPRKWSAGYEEAALGCVAYESYELGTKDMEAECMTALLNGDSIYCGYDRLAHAMTIMELQKKGSEYGFYLPNTWRVTDSMLMFGKSKNPNRAFVVRGVTYSRS